MGGSFREGTGFMEIHAVEHVDARITIPGSKSLTNRYLLLASLAEGCSQLTGALASEDTHYMRLALQALGVPISISDALWTVAGRKTWQCPARRLFIGNAGTAMRFLTPALAIRDFETEIGGNERMAVRPIKDLVTGLRQLGASVAYLGKSGCPPLRIQGPLNGGEMLIRGDASSQYLSGLLMALPMMKQTPRIQLTGDLVSKTYVEMTIWCMSQFGVHWEILGQYEGFRLAQESYYQAASVVVEPDASTASYWFALPLMVGGEVTVIGVPEKSHQGDFGLLTILEQMGAKISYHQGEVNISASQLHGIDVDMNTMSDVAPTLAVIATRAKTPTTIRNIANMRIKECDRIETLQRAFDALGLNMTSGGDWMHIEPGSTKNRACLNPQEDHRMAMVFALLGMAYGGIRVSDPHCVAKTYPNFWQEMGAVTRVR